MTANSPLNGNSSLMSPMTQSYVDAMIREGDSFDYDKWYERALKEAAEANRVVAASAAGEPHVFDFSRTAALLDTSNPPASNRRSGFAQNQRTTWPLGQGPNANASSSSLRQQLEEVCDAFDEFQEKRDRDAVYGYLKAVLQIVLRLKDVERPNDLYVEL